MSQDNQEIMNRILNSVDEIPPMPEVVFKAQQLLADPESSAKELAAILETDQAIATKVLKMANSAFYGMSGKVSSIQHAALVLGYRNQFRPHRSIRCYCMNLCWRDYSFHLS